MKTLDLSLSPRENSRYAVLNGTAETGFLIVRLFKSKPTWQIRHELGDTVGEMLRREIEVEHDDVSSAFAALTGYLNRVGSSDMTTVSFKPAALVA